MRWTMMRSLVLAISLCAGIVVLAALGVALVFFFQHHESESAFAATAEAEFRHLRARFADQQPLLDMQTGQPLTELNRARPILPLHTFHTVIFDTRGGPRFVHITVPYWFGRFFARQRSGFRWLGELTFLGDTEFDPEPTSYHLTCSSAMVLACSSSIGMPVVASSSPGWSNLSMANFGLAPPLSLHPIPRPISSVSPPCYGYYVILRNILLSMSSVRRWRFRGWCRMTGRPGR